MEFKDLLTEHPYYCSDSSYYNLGFDTKYDTFQDFHDEMGNSDLDMNLVFRFDINEKDDGGYYMEIFMVQQRKGRFIPFFIENVSEDDFEMIKEFLDKRYQHMMKLWTPFSN